MADNKLNNYTLIELIHLSYLIRDSLEYCHAQINVTEENFQRRAQMAKNMLAEGNFVAKWLNNSDCDGAGDVDFAEVFALLDLMRNGRRVPLMYDPYQIILNMDANGLCEYLKAVLGEIQCIVMDRMEEK